MGAMKKEKRVKQRRETEEADDRDAHHDSDLQDLLWQRLEAHCMCRCNLLERSAHPRCVA